MLLQARRKRTRGAVQAVALSPSKRQKPSGIGLAITHRRLDGRPGSGPAAGAENSLASDDGADRSTSALHPSAGSSRSPLNRGPLRGLAGPELLPEQSRRRKRIPAQSQRLSAAS